MSRSRPYWFAKERERKRAPFSSLAWSVVFLMASEEPRETLESDALEAFDVAIAEPFEALTLVIPSPKSDVP